MMVLRLLARCVLRSRCPCCGEGALFAGLLRLHATCPHCGLVYEQWVGEWITPTCIASSVGLLAGVAWMLPVVIRERGAASAATEVEAIAVAAAAALLVLRPAKAGWLACLYWMGAVEVSARTRASLRWEAGSAWEPWELERLRAAEARARTLHAPVGPVPVTRRFASLRALLFPRVVRPTNPRPRRSLRRRPSDA
jgi:uncharacterized protein (DUF983 family)